MNKIKKFFGAHKIFMWVFLILVALFIILIIVRTFHYFDVQKTNTQVSKIHSTKLLLSDVTNTKFPSDPGVEGDKTIQGIDVNMNGIRDDVEIAIYKEYPNSAKTRAVLLQYALVLQMETTQPFLNEEIATEISREQSKGFSCIGTIFPDRGSDQSYKKLLSIISFVEDKQFNTKDRTNSRNIFLEKVRSYSDLNESCDIDLSKLVN